MKQTTTDLIEDIMTKSDENEDIISIESRFGSVEVNTSNALFFPSGLLGLPDNLHFCLTSFPDERMSQFKVLQSLNDHSLSFVVLPVDIVNNLIESQDITDACNVLGVEQENLLILLIASVHRTPDNVSLTVNVRAPIMVDAEQKLAAQYVFTNNKYDVRHKIN